jgi:Aldo/keto reductase family
VLRIQFSFGTRRVRASAVSARRGSSPPNTGSRPSSRLAAVPSDRSQLEERYHDPDAGLSGKFTIGGDIIINRLGFGAMSITGPGTWGEPQDPPEALRVLKRLPEVGVNFIDTADSYGPFVSEELIAAALHPYEGLLIATKGGLVRPGVTQGEPT